MVLVSEKTSWDAMLQQGNAGKSRRLRRGFATGKFRENVFVCWLGKGSPKVAIKTRKFVDPGSHVADDVMLNVPVVPVAERPGVTADIKMEVMKNSTWAGKAEGDDEDMDASGSDSSDVGGETPASKSKKKRRGRALLRTPTDNDCVPLFTHPMHPSVCKEFISEFGATWAIFGTPEAGCGLLGALSPQCRVPVVALARNQTHATVLKTLVEDAIAAAVVKQDTDWTMRTLADQWAQVHSESESELETSDVSGASEGNKLEDKSADKDKDDKKGKKRKKSEKAHKSDKTHKKSKKDKNKKDDNKSKDDKKEKDSKKDKNKKGDKKSKGDKAKEVDSLNVLEALLGKNA